MGDLTHAGSARVKPRTGPGGARYRGFLPLRELEAAARLGLAVFLALDDAAVPGQKAAMLQDRAQPRLVEGQGPADAVAHGTGLTRETAAHDGAPDIELAEPIGHDKGLIDQHAQHRTREIDRAVTA